MKKERELTDMQRAFIAAMSDPANKGNARQCMTLAGYAESIAPHVVLNTLTEELVDVAHKLLARYGVKAAITMGDSLEKSNTADGRLALAAANSILDRIGVIKKTEGEINLKVPSGGLFILPAKENTTLSDE